MFNNRYIKYIFLSAAAVVMLSAGSFAAPMQSTNYQLPANTVHIAGSGESSTSYGLLESVVQPSTVGTIESTNYLLGMGNMFTFFFEPYSPAGIPTIEVEVNGRRFVDGDILPPYKTNSANITVFALAPVATIEMLVDGDNVLLIPVAGTPPSWSGAFSIVPHPQQPIHYLTFYVSDEAGNTNLTTLETRVLAGGVQVVGTPLNYPNPFSPLSGQRTVIQYTLSTDAQIKILIFDITGQEVMRMSFDSGDNGGRAGINSVDLQYSRIDQIYEKKLVDQQ